LFFNQPPTAKLGYFSTPTSEQKKEKDRFELRGPTVFKLKNCVLCMDNMRFATKGHVNVGTPKFYTYLLCRLVDCHAWNMNGLFLEALNLC